MTREWKVLDLFSGIGGFSLGLEKAGFWTVAFCEIDPFCRRILEKHWPGVRIYDDISATTFRNADIICGGFPCQDISAMGERAGLAGANSGLWREMVRVIRLVRPRYAIVENVADLLGFGMDEVLRDLASVGYDAEWHCIPAGALGSPHERDRIWIVAHTQKESGLYKSYTWERAERLLDYSTSWQASSWDETEPKVCRVDDGVSDRVDRTGVLGNAIVPQIAEHIGKSIKELND